MSTAYHPQTDGQTERVNQSLEQYLRMFCDHRPDDWATLLSTAEFAYNNAAHESTGLSPFYVEYGWNPRMAPDVTEGLEHPSLTDIFQNRAEAREQAQASLTMAAERMKWYYDKHKLEVPFKVGDKVLLKGKDMRIRASSAKLSAKHYGPYEIVEQLGPVNFKLKLPRQVRVHPVFHASKFIPYHEDKIGGRKPTKPPPIEVEGYEEYEAEQILDSRVHHGWIQYHVSDATWEPVCNCANAPELVKQFHVEHPDAPQPLSFTNARPVSSEFHREIWHERFDGAQP